MFKLSLPSHRIIQYPIFGSYALDFTPQETYFEYKAVISLNHNGDALGGGIVFIEAFDRDGGELDTDQLLKDYPYVNDNIIEEATRKAIEKVENVDFEVDCERE